jgi:osmotically-inducible protein OsmY
MQRNSTLALAASVAFAFAVSALARETIVSPAATPDPVPILGPVEQGNSKADVKMTAKIRREIMASNQMSLAAQNVTIITNAGKVTLQGPVDTATEKRLIGEMAVRTAKPGNVDNQLVVTIIANDGAVAGQPAPPITPQ